MQCSIGVVDTVGIAVGDMGNSWGGRISYSQQTGGGSDGGGGLVSQCGGGLVSQCRGGMVGESVIADSDVGLPDAGERSVDGLGVGGHLSEVSVAPQDVGLLGGDGGGGDGSGGCVSDGGCGSITHSGGPDVTGVGGSHEGDENQYLRLENYGKRAEIVNMCLRLLTRFNHAKYLCYYSVTTVANHTCTFTALTTSIASYAP